MIAILLGPPGVGKGTQGVRLTEALDWRHLSTGDLLRSHRRDGTELGREAQGFMDRGELVPDHLILAMVRAELSGLDADDGVVFDGFPRTVGQAEGLDDVLDGVSRSVDLVLLLEADRDVLVQRLSGRRSCPACGAVYNVHFSPPSDPDRCDRCAHDGLVHRADDAPETVVRRLEVYERQTAPLIAFYEKGAAPLERIDGTGPVDEIQRAIRKAVELEGRGSRV